MKSYYQWVYLFILFLSACGQSTDSKKPIDYFSEPFKVSAAVTTGALEAKELIITGINRDSDTITLNFKITATNSSSNLAESTITLSGKDKYNLQVMSPKIIMTLQAGETKTIDQIETFNASLLLQVDSWAISSIALTEQTTTQPITTETTITPPPEIPSTPIATDTTATVQLNALEPIEIGRTYTDVNFATRFSFKNLSSSKVNVHLFLKGADVSDNIIFSRDIFDTLQGKESHSFTISYGSVLTIPQYDSITKWFVSDFTRY